jgi:tetratricopeptide (TPR) repeat protein
VDVCLLSGFEAWKNGNNDEALKFMLLANEYPENHGYAHLEYYARDAQVYYNIGLAYEKVGDAENAHKYYQMASEVEVKDKDSKYNYEKGLAIKKLNPKTSVKAMYKNIIKNGKASLTTYVQRFWESFDRGPYEQDINSEAYYTQAIGYKALGRNFKARRMMKKALKQRNDHLWANYYLDRI